MATPDLGAHHHLHAHGHSPVHRLAPETKLLGLIAFVTVVAVTPRRHVAAFFIDALVVVAVAALAGLRPRLVLARLAAVVPFVAFAAFLPFVGGGEQVSIAGLSVSVDGVWAMWNILAKALIGATAGIVVTATTPVPDLLAGLSRLRVPAVFVGIISFMFRYLELIVDELATMRRAMTARGHDPRWLWQAKPIATSAGTLFVRTYERGERIHDAMLARGFQGTLPRLREQRPSRGDWVRTLVPALIAFLAALTGLVGGAA